MRRTLWTFTALTLLAFATSADARPGGRGMHGGPPPGALLAHHAEELGLDDDTREAIGAIVEASHEESRALRSEAREARHAIRALLEADPVDRGAVMAAVEHAGELETEAEKHRIETMLAIREQLSPEQRAAMVGLRERMRERHFGPILDACAEEAEARCEGAGPGAVHCLLRQRDDLSGACAEALESLPGHFGHRAHGKCGHGAPGKCGHGAPGKCGHGAPGKCGHGAPGKCGHGVPGKCGHGVHGKCGAPHCRHHAPSESEE